MNILEKWLYQPKYKIIFLRMHEGVYFVHKIKMLKEIAETIKGGKEREYQIDITKPVYIFKNIRTYLFDYETGSQFSLIEIKGQIPPKILDMLMANKVMREFSSGAMDNTRMKILYTAVGAIIGGLIGVVVMQSVMRKKIEELYDELTITTNPYEFPAMLIKMGVELIKCLM